jgi:alpha-N-acetylglucosamine transferase
MRLVLSLRWARTTLPIRLHVSGERHERYEAAFLRQGVEVVSAPTFKLPGWANPWHAGTFSKLAALSVTDTDRIIVLDVDCVVFRNIDHLAGERAVVHHAIPTTKLGGEVPTCEAAHL